MSSLTSTGLIIDTTDQILTAIESDELSTIDPALNTAPTQPLGQINGIFASKQEDGLQLTQAVYGALDPASAEGQQLDVTSALTGTTRAPATSTIVSCTVNLDAGHVFAAATIDKNGNVVTPGQILAQISGHPEFVFTNKTAIDTTSAGGAANYTVFFVCEQTGPIACNAGTLTVISPIVAGFNSITNPLDADSLGAAVETDTALRVRREAELVPAGGGTLDSMRQSLAKVTGVLSAQVLENYLDATDANGLPPHSFEAVIWDGATPLAANNDVAQAVWNAKPAGIRPYDGGSGISGTAIDSAGGTHTVGFARATQDSYHIAITVSIDSTLYPSDGDAQLAAALVAFGNALKVGANVIVEAFKAQAFGIAGVTDVPTFKIDTTVTPTNTANITTAANHIARFDSSRIVVTHA